MEIVLKNVDEDFVFVAQGPQVEFDFEDSGQANVTMVLSLDDGTHFNYPTGEGKRIRRSTTLAPRFYLGALTIVAMGIGDFPKTFRSKVSIGGKTLATATGTIPADAKTDQHTAVFQLQVTP